MKASASRPRSARSRPDVRELFQEKTLPDIQTDYSPSLRRWTEAKLGVRLPENYIALLKTRNGGKLRMRAIKLRGPSQKQYGGKVYTFDRIAGLDQRHHESITNLTEIAQQRWEVPAGLFPIDGDGHSWLCLDYRRCGPEGEPVVTEFDTEHNQEFRVAPSFHDLLTGLFFDAGEYVFAIDDPELTGERLHRELVALGCKGRYPRDATKQARKKTPQMWNWPEYEGEFGGPATTSVYENGTIDPWTLARPANYPLLLVNVSRKDQQRCVRRLAETFADSVVLIHQPADRPPIRGLPQPHPPAKRRRPPPAKLNPQDLNSAILHRNWKLAKGLLRNGARPDKRYFGPKSATAIDIAVGYGQTALLKLLLKYTHRPLDKGLLSRAINGGHLGFIKVLLNRGLKPNQEDLVSAVTDRHVPVVRLLLSLGVRPSPKAIRRAAGIVEPGLEIPGFPGDVHRPILRLLKKAGTTPPDATIRRLFETL